MFKRFLFSIGNQYVSKWIILLIDIIIIIISFVISYFIRFNLSFNFAVENLLIQLPVIILIFGLTFLITKSHMAVVRHTGIKDVYAIFNSVCLASASIIVFIMVNRKFNFCLLYTSDAADE